MAVITRALVQLPDRDQEAFKEVIRFEEEADDEISNVAQRQRESLEKNSVVQEKSLLSTHAMFLQNYSHEFITKNKKYVRYILNENGAGKCTAAYSLYHTEREVIFRPQKFTLLAKYEDPKGLQFSVYEPTSKVDLNGLRS